MTARDREITLTKYNALFDEAINEEEVVRQLGSPTRAAILELRGYVPSPEPDPETETPTAEVPDRQSGREGLMEPEPMPEALSAAPGRRVGEGPAVPEPAPAADEDVPEPGYSEARIPDFGGDADGDADEAVPDASAVPETAAAPGARAIGWRLGLYTLFGILVCIPAEAVLIVLSLCVLALGAGFLALAAFVISLGFTGVSVFADVILLFGAGLMLAAPGIPLLFFAVWFFLRAAVGFVNLILRTGRRWCFEPAKEAKRQ